MSAAVLIHAAVLIVHAAVDTVLPYTTR